MVSQARIRQNKISLAGAIGAGIITPGAGGGVPLPLPALPLAVGARVAVHGDSQSHLNHGTGIDSGGTDILGLSTKADGPMAVAHGIDPRFNFTAWYEETDPWIKQDGTKRNIGGANQGIGGDHLEWGDPTNNINGGGTLKRLDYTIARKPDIVVLISLGFNTINTGDPTSGSTRETRSPYAIDKIEKHLKKLRQAGIWALITTLYPTDYWDAGDYRYGVMDDVNAWIRAQASREGVVVVDATTPLLANGVIDPTFFTIDVGKRIHLNPKGAITIGRDVLAPALASMVAAGSVLNQDPTVDNLLGASMGQLAGSGGAKAGATGAVATGAKLTRGSGVAATGVASKVGSSGVTKQAFEITPDGTKTTADPWAFDFTDTNVVTLPVAGEWIRAYVLAEITGDVEAAAMLWLTMHLIDTTASNARRASVRAMWASFGVTGYGVVKSAAGVRKQWLITPPLLVPSTVFDKLTLRSDLYALGSGTLPYKVTLERPIVRKVSDPRPAWGY